LSTAYRYYAVFDSPANLAAEKAQLAHAIV